MKNKKEKIMIFKEYWVFIVMILFTLCVSIIASIMLISNKIDGNFWRVLLGILAFICTLGSGISLGTLISLIIEEEADMEDEE